MNATTVSPSASGAARQLTRAQVQNLFGKLRPGLRKGLLPLLDQLLGLLNEQGEAKVSSVHEALFPAAGSARLASAQLSNLLASLAEAAREKGLVFAHAYRGSKQAGADQRTLVFEGAPPTLSPQTEGLNAIAPAQRIGGQLGRVLSAPALLYTCNEHEYAAVRKFFCAGMAPAGWPAAPDAPPVEDLGLHGGLRVLLHHGRQGNRESQRAASELYAAYRPKAIVAVGIAFGVDESRQALGDVLVSAYICDYETALIREGKLSLRGPRPPASRHLVQSLETLNIRQRHGQDAGVWPQLRPGGVLSGEKLVDDIDYRDSLRALAGQDDIVGGEMESAGLAKALEGLPVDWIVIKGICDWADGKKGQDKDRRQHDAAENAARVLKALFDSNLLYPPGPPESDSPQPRDRGANPLSWRPQFACDPHAVDGQRGAAADLAQAFAPQRAPKTTAESPEGEPGPGEIVAFDDLLQWQAQAEGPPLYALLGEYGMGKTTHCQRLYAHLRAAREQGEAVRQPLYFDLRKVENLRAATAQGPGKTPVLREVIEDCLRQGYLHEGGEAPRYEDVLTVIDQGALVIFDGLDEVLARLADAQAASFVANLLRVLPEAAERQRGGQAHPPKVLVSCRTQYFRSLLEQHRLLTGGHRGEHQAEQYRALVLCPLTEEQVSLYLQAVFPAADQNQLHQQLAAVHNLRELTRRPFTLKLVSQFVPRLEQWRAEGRRISGATLYREVAAEWLIRDQDKQAFAREDKERLAADLAAHLWRQGRRGLPAKDLEDWLGGWLTAQDPGADFHQVPRAVLQQDLRNSSFLRRDDTGEGSAQETGRTQSRFEFAHSSLHDFFLADYLHRALRAAAQAWADEPENTAAQQAARQRWAFKRRPSAEALDFLGQLLDEDGSPAAQHPLLAVLQRWRTPYLAGASELQLAYAQHAYQRHWPLPHLAGMDLQGADLSDWHLGNADEEPLPTPRKLDLGAARLQGARLRRTRWWNVRLSGADLDGAWLSQAEFLHCAADGLRGAVRDAAGARWRDCSGQLPWSVASPSSATFRRLRPLGAGGRPMNACAWSADGARLASAGFDGCLRIWDADSGECLRVLSGHKDGVNSCAWSADGARLASAGAYGGLRVWDADSGECLWALGTHDGGVVSCAWSADGMRLASASGSGNLVLWDADNGKRLRVLRGHEDLVRYCAWSADGRRLASTGRDAGIRIWDADSGECLRVLSGHPAGAWSCAWSVDGVRLASSSVDGTVRIWHADSGECLRVLSGHRGTVWSCAWSPDGARLVSAGGDGRLRMWDADNGECLRVLSGHERGVVMCSWSTDGVRLMSAGGDGRLCVWDANNGECLRVFRGHEDWLVSFAWSADGSCLASAGSDGRLRVWNADSGKCLLVLSGHQRGVFSCIWSADGTRLASADFDGYLRTWDIESGECLRVLRVHEGEVFCCAWSVDGVRLAGVGRDGCLRIWDAARGECLRVLSGHERGVMSCIWSADGARLASADLDGCLRIWDIDSGECLRVLRVHRGGVFSCAWSPDGTRLAGGGRDGRPWVWDADTGECLRVLSGHEGEVCSYAWSADGARLAGGGRDGRLWVWDADSGECLRVLSGHEGTVWFCAWSADGARLASASGDGTLRLWNPDSGACELALLHADAASAAWRPGGDASPDTLLYAQGRAWRYLRWQGLDAQGHTRVWPLEPSRTLCL